MANPRDYCFHHARMYSGWRCPLCVEEEAECRRNAGETPTAAEPTLVQAPAPELPALDPEASALKRQEAERDLIGNKARDALDLSEQAVRLDPQNLRAHLIGARACRILGEGAREAELLEAAVDLLRQPQHAASGEAFLEVLKHLRNGRLIGQVVRIYLTLGSRPIEEVLPLVRVLVAHGAVSDALVLLDLLPPSARSLATCAYTLEVTGRAFHGIPPELHEYLHGVPSDRRDHLLEEFVALRQDPTLGRTTVNAIRDALQQRYDEWATDIGQQLGQKARAEALAAIGSAWVGTAVARALATMAAGLVVAVVLMLVVGGKAVLLTGMALAFLCAGGGFVYGREAEMGRQLQARLPAIKQTLAEDELNRWLGVLHEGADEQEALLQAATTDTCPFCAAQVPDPARTCPRCGHDLPSGATGGGPKEAATPVTDGGASTGTPNAASDVRVAPSAASGG